ncbi:hypothetical protein MMC13_005711 [Lambiella insularis]|nr:hypothetical protein [Lambiella insularis]
MQAPSQVSYASCGGGTAYSAIVGPDQGRGPRPALVRPIEGNAHPAATSGVLQTIHFSFEATVPSQSSQSFNLVVDGSILRISIEVERQHTAHRSAHTRASTLPHIVAQVSAQDAAQTPAYFAAAQASVAHEHGKIKVEQSSPEEHRENVGGTSRENADVIDWASLLRAIDSSSSARESAQVTDQKPGNLTGKQRDDGKVMPDRYTYYQQTTPTSRRSPPNEAILYEGSDHL